MDEKFKLASKYSPTGDQPRAIEKLAAGISDGKKHQTLVGVTGSGKTFTMAAVIEKIQRPALIISPNKTLAAQLYQEFKEFFPENSVHYFVSYYDYYQPEAYIPTTDTYIEKDAAINEELDRLRHEATQALLSRSDVIVVASVSCIYNIGSPAEYEELSFEITAEQETSQRELMAELIKLQYSRNDFEKLPGTFSAKGERIEIRPSSGTETIIVEIPKNKIEKIYSLPAGLPAGASAQAGASAKDGVPNGKNYYKNQLAERRALPAARIFPAKFWVAPEKNIKAALKNIKVELKERLAELKKRGKLLEAQRLKERTNFDLEMLEETGYCRGIENYSRQLESRPAGSPPFTLIDYFKFRYGENFLAFMDESHIGVPQLRGMHAGDRSRKETLIKYGFRLLSALDNRPLKFAEFEKMIPRTVYVSATPADYELQKSQLGNPVSKSGIIEQLIRPTGLLDPEIEVRPTKNQIPDLMKEIKKRVAKKQRVLATVLTKRLSEELADFLTEERIKTQFLHSEIHTLERTEILRDLRLGKFDVLVGVNLLREGLDLPEVSLVAILDADKEGFLRNATTLIQTSGRAARHEEGKVIMYADKITKSMAKAIEETERRRKIQEDYNKKHDIVPKTIKKEIRENIIARNGGEKKNKYSVSDYRAEYGSELPLNPEKTVNRQIVSVLKKELKDAVKNLDFEKAAYFRDEIAKYGN